MVVLEQGDGTLCFSNKGRIERHQMLKKYWDERDRKERRDLDDDEF